MHADLTTPGIPLSPPRKAEDRHGWRQTVRAEKTIPARELREWFKYDPETGALDWLKRRKFGPKYLGPAGGISKAGYWTLTFCGFHFKAHRIAWALMTGAWPPSQIDHANGDRSDNRWVNLRLATNQLNAVNSRRNSRNTSGFKGVSKKGKSWMAVTYVNRRQVYIGRFKTPEAAHAAYLARVKAIFGEFARAE